MERKDTAPSAAEKAREENAAIVYSNVKEKLEIEFVSLIHPLCVPLIAEHHQWLY